MEHLKRGENAAQGIRRALKKRALAASTESRDDEVHAATLDGTLSVFWRESKLSVVFSPCADTYAPLTPTEYVHRYNALSPTFSHAELSADRGVLVSGFDPGKAVGDDADEVEFVLEIILSDILGTHAAHKT